MNNGGNGMTTRSAQITLTPKAVESLAVEAFAFIAGGLDPSSLRAAAKDPHFLAGVLDYVITDERLIFDLAAATGHRPESIVAACRSLKGPAPDDCGL